MKTRSCVISLIGRPNVGKSSIFNRLMRQNYKAMTFDQPGVTRDRHYGIASLDDRHGENEKDFILVDTGGFYPDKIEEEKALGKRKTAEPFFNIMAEHAKLAIEESDLVLMIVDVREGMLPFDKTIFDYIRTTKKQVWVIANKFDTDKQWGQEAEFYELGMKEDNFFIVSAEHGRGLPTLRERIYDFNADFILQEQTNLEVQRGVTPTHDVVGNVAIIGAPNAGKSTLLNRFLGAPRALVSDIAGTTVDPIEGYFDINFGKKVELLVSRDNEFRKTNTDLLDEFHDFKEIYNDSELVAYGEMTADTLGVSHIEDETAQESDADLVFDAPEDNDLFTIDDLDQSVSMELQDDVENSAEEQSAEATDTPLGSTYRTLKLVDTAGIRKQKSVSGFIEEQSVYRSLRAITEADIILYVVDATKGISHQDRRLVDIALDKGKSIIICLNKIDLLKEVMQDKKRKKEWLLDLRGSIPWLSFCELITISALKGSYISSLRQSIKSTIIIRNQKVTTGKLNKTITALVDKHPIVLEQTSTRFKIKYGSMLKTSPPTFLLFSNKSKGIPANYRKYLTNGLRKEFGMINTPVHLIFRTTTDLDKRLRKTEVE